MGGACGLCVNTIFVAEKFAFFGKKVFSAERFTIKRLFYTSYKMAISVQIPMLKVNLLISSLHSSNEVHFLVFHLLSIQIHAIGM